MFNGSWLLGKQMGPQVKRSLYYQKEYDTKWRFCSYWHQIQEILSLSPNCTLEIGVGNHLVSRYLMERGFDIVTLDLEKQLHPHAVGTVLEIPFCDGSFEVVACYELLEHLPYENFRKALAEISRVSSSHAILSLPDISRVFTLHLQIPKIEKGRLVVGEIKKLLPLPVLRKPVHRFDGEHYWEIGKANYSLGKVTNDIEKAGFIIERTYRVFEAPFHRFFMLGKQRTRD